MIDGHPPRRFAGEPRAARSGGERELAIRGAKREPVPGRRTLSETLAPGGVEIERLFAAQLATAQQQLVPLNDANTAGDHHASNIAACVIRRALHVAGDVVAFARREQHEDTGAMEARLSVIEDECRSALERAFTPSSAAIARSVDDTSRQRWDREASAWRVAHGHTEPASTPAADRPRGGLDDRGLGPLGDTHPGPDDEVGHQHGAIPLTNVEQQPSKVPEPIVQVLESAQGTPLPACESWSQRIGVDVGHARLVAGDGASAAARSIGARAFTVGHRVFLGAGNDASTDGGGLLAHELKHVAQQRGASRPGSWHELPFVASSDHRENEARSPDASTGATSEMAIARDDQHASHAASENARTYVGGPYVSQKVRELLERLGIVAHGPFGKYLEARPSSASSSR